MTFIFGYIYNGAVHIIADSVETISAAGRPDEILPEEFSSTMIESSIVKDEQLMTECAHKIYNIQDRLILGFAGQVSEGTKMIERLVSGLVKTDDMRAYISRIFDQEKPRKTEYIIGFMEEERPCMYCYRSPFEEFKMVRNLAFSNIGKNEWVPPETIATMLRLAFENSHNQDDLLITAISTIQTTTIGMRTLEQGVGGYINGVYIANSGIHWAKDTTYVLYSSLHQDRPETIYNIAKYNRDNAVFIQKNGQLKIFRTEPDLTGENLEKKWSEHLEILANSNISDYYILLSYDKHVIFLINNKLNNSCKVFIKKGALTFSPDLVKANTLAHNRRSDPNAPFILVSNLP
ncbi:hypothetical protein [Chitinophaga sp. RAB17]|uniref:hypothetical protein n=1 Tax=Chitinophaga sp. RAB17 TaxID=3233049 RepID=UPI003F922D35